MDRRLELAADLNAQDDDGDGWSTLSDASEPAAVQPGVVLVAGNRHAQANVRILSVDGDRPGPLPDSVAVPE